VFLCFICKSLRICCWMLMECLKYQILDWVHCLNKFGWVHWLIFEKCDNIITSNWKLIILLIIGRWATSHNMRYAKLCCSRGRLAFAACYHYILSHKLLFFFFFITTSLSSRWFTTKVMMVQRQIYGHVVLFSLF